MILAHVPDQFVKTEFRPAHLGYGKSRVFRFNGVALANLLEQMQVIQIVANRDGFAIAPVVDFWSMM